MKKLLIVLLIAGCVVTPLYAQNPQAAIADSDQKVWFVAPYDIATIPANTAITTWDADTNTLNGSTGIKIIAITPNADVNAYYEDDSSTTFLLEAGDTITLGRRVLKLAAETDCLIY